MGLPKLQLAEDAYDLNWLVEDLKADFARQAAIHTVDADTLRGRIAQLEARQPKQRHWLITVWEAIDFYVGGAIGTILALWSAQIAIN